MRIEVLLQADPAGGYAIHVPAFDIWSQGETLEECHAMAVDAVHALAEAVLEEELLGAVEAFPENGGRFTVQVPTEAGLRLMLKQLRSHAGLSLAQASERLGSRSKNGIAQYEQGAREPGLRKLEDLIGAMNLDLVVSVRER
jgi:predicted RNase H-like HicB family nuclease